MNKQSITKPDVYFAAFHNHFCKSSGSVPLSTSLRHITDENGVRTMATPEPTSRSRQVTRDRLRKLNHNSEASYRRHLARVEPCLPTKVCIRHPNFRTTCEPMQRPSSLTLAGSKDADSARSAGGAQLKVASGLLMQLARPQRKTSPAECRALLFRVALLRIPLVTQALPTLHPNRELHGYMARLPTAPIMAVTMSGAS